MEIVVAGHHTDVPERFRSHVESKLSKLEQYDARVQRVDVEVIHERNPRQNDVAERVEITARGKGPVMRAEASAPDRYAALDAAIAKLLERARRVHDRRKTHRKSMRRSGTPVDVGQWEPPMDAGEESPAAAPGDTVEIPLGDSPVVIREKVHVASPMSVEDAIYEMELVGHPFFLFIESASNEPAVLYHRHGWTYGVIRLTTPEEAAES
ncbi:MAG: ribosome-associated translation inhibitor RaiA [Bifidobacteriaceae bacterium]|jgi:ribosomal subunit interface protein|nr:ribosome-associated translation inhibitor RaiA [Bifidobacteriaceae bacterium]